MKIHHIGYAVRKLEASIQGFEKLGYLCEGNIVCDEERNVSIQFMKNQAYLIELVAPLNAEAPIWERLKKQGEGPYHICYETVRLDEQINKLLKESYVLINDRAPAPAINNQRVAFLYKRGMGIIELVEAAHENML